MSELVDAHVSGACVERHAGSSPVLGKMCIRDSPKETERPKVIKASATDIPVFYLNLTLKNDSAYSITGQQSFLDLCEFAEFRMEL